MIWNASRWLLALSLFALFATTGCRKVRMLTGIGLEVVDAEAGSAEEVIQEVFTAALLDSQSKGWNLFRKHIHPEKNSTVIQKEEWKVDRFPRLRRNIDHYILDPSLASFKITNEQVRENGRVLLHIKNSSGDVSTPCTLKKDARNKWKLWSCSL
jgi:hypothetical protein